MRLSMVAKVMTHKQWREMNRHLAWLYRNEHYYDSNFHARGFC